MGTTKATAANMVRIEHAKDFELDFEPITHDDKAWFLTLGAACDADRADKVQCVGQSDLRKQSSFGCASPVVELPADVWEAFKAKHRVAIEHFVAQRDLYVTVAS